MTCLITGASSGIGLELARIAAAARHDVVLVARSRDTLTALASSLTAEHGIRAHTIVADLGDPAAPAQVASEVAATGLEIAILINNAGFGLFGPFVSTPLETEVRMIQVNVVALTELTKRLLPPMIARRHGQIMNVASTAAFFPGPLMAVYYATKAYVLSFSEAIAEELSGTGVTVTALCPGPTTSGFQAAAHLEESKLFAGRTLATSREVAEAGWRAMMAGQAIEVPGVTNKLTVAAPRFMPRRMMAKIVRGVQEKRRLPYSHP